MDARTKEAIRYLGYGRHAVDEQTLALIDALLRIRHELQYRLTPLPELFAALALCCVGALGGVCAAACARRPE